MPGLSLIYVINDILPSWHTLPLCGMLNEFSVTFYNLILPVVIVRICIDTQWMLLILILILFIINVSVTTPALELIMG